MWRGYSTWRLLAPDQVLRPHYRRPGPPRELYDLYLDNFAIAEMRGKADAFDPPFAEELPAGTASPATIAHELSQPGQLGVAAPAPPGARRRTRSPRGGKAS